MSLEIKNLSLRFNGILRPFTRPIEKLIQHHMAHPSWDAIDVHLYHRDSNGWLGAGYNYFIRFNGDIIEMRGQHQGAHAGANWNGRSYGIGYQGNLETQQMSDEQLRAGIALNYYLLKENNLKVFDIVGHSYASNTLWPGRNFKLTELRAGVERLLKSSPPEDEEPILNNTYIVRPGDTLTRIATRVNVTVEAILRLNPDIKNSNLIIPGQKILLSGSKVGGSTKEEQEGEEGEEDPLSVMTYTVQRGDTLNNIAKSMGTTTEEILKLNSQIKNRNMIYPGQEFLVPVIGSVRIIPPHTVKRGETLGGISKRYGYLVEQLVEYNRIENANLIYPGQTIKFPIR